MRYILNDEGYIAAITFGESLECYEKTCTEYTGSVPTGYETLAEWSENANINAYKIVDGELAYDSDKDTELQSLWASQICVDNGVYSTEETVIGTYLGKKHYRKVLIIPSLPSTTTETTYAHGISNLEEFSHIYGTAYLKQANGQTYQPTLPHINPTNLASSISVGRYEDDYISIQVGQDRSSFSAKVTLEYIKTID